MLLQVDPSTREARRVSGTRLKEFGLDERGLQDVLFRTLDRLIGEDELLLLTQSRHWREEPDLMALDRDGNLYIFEIKVWESQAENLLQVLRYGQLNGALDYDGLHKIWARHPERDHSLLDAHSAKFDVRLDSADFNRRQVFVVLTNGLDADTRKAIRYWRSTGLDVRPWIYRSYKIEGKMLLEISPFRTSDDPLEDQSETYGDGFYILNTNKNNDPANDVDMISNRKAAAYAEPWKYKIERLKPGDHVFLYRSGAGIVAIGKADGKLRKADHFGERDYEYFMSLGEFAELPLPLSAAEVKALTSNPGMIFRQTMFSLDRSSGEKLYKAAKDRSQVK